MRPSRDEGSWVQEQLSNGGPQQRIGDLNTGLDPVTAPPSREPSSQTQHCNNAGKTAGKNDVAKFVMVV